MQWTAQQSIDKFEFLARDIFKRRSTGSSVFAWIQDLLLSYIEDGQYNQEAITGAFSAVGAPVQMFNPLNSHTRVAVTSTTAKGTRACLFTNYNGNNQSEEVGPVGYDVIRAHRAEFDITVGEA